MSYIQNAANGIGGCPVAFVRKNAKADKKGLSKQVRTLAVARFKEILRRAGNVLRDVHGNPVKIDPSVFNIFEALMMHFHNKDTGQCNPSGKAIAQILGCSTKTVTRANKIFMKIGLMKVDKTTYTPTEQQKKSLPAKVRKYKKVRGSNRYCLVKGILSAMFVVLKRLDAGGKIVSLIKNLGLRDIVKKKKINKFYRSDDEKIHAAQQACYEALTSQPNLFSEEDQEREDYIKSLPMRPKSVKSDPVQDILNRHVVVS